MFAKFFRRRGRDWPTDDCLIRAAITVPELRTAAAAVDAGDHSTADTLMARVSPEHHRCVAFEVLRYVDVLPADDEL